MQIFSILSSLIAFSLFSLISVEAHAGAPPLGHNVDKYIGEHAPLFVIEKSINRQNILVAYTKIDKNCRIVYDQRKNQPTFGIYWLDDGVRFSVDSTLGQILRRLPVERGFTSRGSEDPTSFFVRFTDLKQVRHDLADDRLLIKAEREGGSCLVKAYVTLKDETTVRVTSIYTNMTLNFFTFDADVNSLMVVGHDAENVKAKIERKYDSSRKGRSLY